MNLLWIVLIDIDALIFQFSDHIEDPAMSHSGDKKKESAPCDSILQQGFEFDIQE